jgi:D-3-phosphoglycerate dehydrogenase
LGRIGQEVARRAASFDMRIIAHDPFISEDVAGDLGVELVSLDDLFARSDFLSLHMPSTPTTKNIVNAERLGKAKKGIRIINTARGDLIDETALADAIESGHVGGAALDVFQKEPTVDHRLRRCRRSSRHHILRRRRARGRNWSAWKRWRRCATSCATASSAMR